MDEQGDSDVDIFSDPESSDGDKKANKIFDSEALSSKEFLNKVGNQERNSTKNNYYSQNSIFKNSNNIKQQSL